VTRRVRVGALLCRRGVLLGMLFVLGTGVILADELLPTGQRATGRDRMLAASSLMREATAQLRACREGLGIPLNGVDDVNSTGLIGLRFSPITTTLGSLESKRTTTNPNMAGLLVRLLEEAGAHKGDAVAIGGSGSFPALILATLCAARVVGAEPLLVCSLGASEWGANDPGFTWLAMEECLVEAGLLEESTIAVSLGGDRDQAADLEPVARETLDRLARASGLPVVSSDDLEENVRQRMRLYDEAADGERIAAFVNIGGSWADLGTAASVLDLTPGLTVADDLPPVERRGVLFAMAARGIPIIHLLDMKHLALRYGLAWDPTPLPAVGEGDFYAAGSGNPAWFLVAGSVYLGVVTLGLGYCGCRRARLGR